MIQAINSADTGADKTETESAPVPLEYARTLATARKVMDLSAANLTPPRPSIYSVWFNYVTGDNIEAKSRVRNLLQSGSPVSAYDLEQVHNECLAFDTVREASIAAANNKLENELADVLQAVQAHIASSEDYCGSLSRKSQDLTANPNVETIRDLIQTLLSENATMRKNTEVLGASLEQSRAQINQLHDALVESRMSANTDQLTGLGNRRGFQARLNAEIQATKENQQRLCLIIADIDHFKRINDTFGHTIGDEVLRFFGGILDRHKGENCYAARYGGEEFAIILPDTGHAAARQFAEKLREQFSAVRLYVAESREQIGVVTASFGVAEHLAGEPFESLIQRADDRLYKAKSAGRNRVL